MTAPDLRAFYRSLDFKIQVDEQHRYYVPLLEATPRKDPVLRLETNILNADSESVHLLTGYRGNGKSTQLRRLKHLLEKQGCTVYAVDIGEWLMLSKPVQLEDFLISLTGALAEAQRGNTGPGAAYTGWWGWVNDRLERKVDVDAELTLDAQVAQLKLALKTNPTFKEQLQARLKQHTSRLVAEVGRWINELVDERRRALGDPDHKVVLLVDTLEQLRGEGSDATEVLHSARELFSTQAASLRLPKLHVVYTFPPSLQTIAQNLGQKHGCAVAMWPNVHVRKQDGAPDPEGLKTLRGLIDKRFACRADVIPDPLLDELISASGGDIRDLFRLLREVIVSAQIEGGSQVQREMCDHARSGLLRELLPIADADARWLLQVHQRRNVALDDVANLPTLARFFDSNLIMNYENGQPWYDVHPLILPEIERIGRA